MKLFGQCIELVVPLEFTLRPGTTQAFACLSVINSACTTVQTELQND